MSGSWNRDLGADLDAIRDWGAVAVVTLVEDRELTVLQVPELGAEVRARHMDWLHLPITNISVPGEPFERQWDRAGAGLRGRLRSGFDIVVHCKGGLGRAGTIAARLMVELGVNSARSISTIRAVRPGAIENAEQERFVLELLECREPEPATSAEAIRDRAVGALLGLAVGDAIGTTLEFWSYARKLVTA